MHQTLRGDDIELFVQHGGAMELKSDCGWRSAWIRTFATLPAIGGLTLFAPVFETAGGYSQPCY